MTDDYRAYKPFKKVMEHKSVNHSNKQYVDGENHTNTIESFWAIIKRGIFGQYHHISKKYLDDYVKEFTFKYNNRKNDGMFDLLLTNAVC